MRQVAMQARIVRWKPDELATMDPPPSALLAASIRQLERVAKLDWCGPVAEIQSSLERLRVVKIRQFKWIMLLSPLVGF